MNRNRERSKKPEEAEIARHNRRNGLLVGQGRAGERAAGVRGGGDAKERRETVFAVARMTSEAVREQKSAEELDRVRSGKNSGEYIHCLRRLPDQGLKA